ncbi:MAG TPA: RHS repeat-associated core domain-containing protein [Candidatus Nitrosotenuis sp.]|nr:RHS repeat-associated core domain-containing protein [Candidatus Nitrosotenuis sp.]
MSQTQRVSYLTTDHLGSPRVITDQSGAVVSRKDFVAYRDEIVTPQRTAGLGYQPTNIREDYTGYQRDEESGLEFAEARYYNPLHGRFTSVDPMTASATSRNPQMFNRYVYAVNSLYKFTDPLWLIPSTTGACGSWCPGGDSGSFGAGGGFDTIASMIGIDIIYQIERTMIFTIPHREYNRSNQIVNEAMITVTVNQILQYERSIFFGQPDRLIYASPLNYDSSAVNSKVGHYSASQLRDMATTAQRIIQVGLETNRSSELIKTMFAIVSRKESKMGIGARTDTLPANNIDPAKDPMIDPGQLDKRSGFAPRANDWYYNIKGAYDHFENVMQQNFPNRKSLWNQRLLNRLRYYNGGPNALRISSTLIYANEVIETMKLISIQTLTLPPKCLYGFPIQY